MDALVLMVFCDNGHSNAIAIQFVTNIQPDPHPNPPFRKMV